MLDSLQAMQLLDECTGDDIWSIDYCQQQGIPTTWIEELRDCYESGFEHHSQTIFYRGAITNQFEGVRDVDLALRLADLLGLDVRPLIERSLTRTGLVSALKEAVEEG